MGFLSYEAASNPAVLLMKTILGRPGTAELLSELVSRGVHVEKFGVSLAVMKEVLNILKVTGYDASEELEEAAAFRKKALEGLRAQREAKLNKERENSGRSASDSRPNEFTSNETEPARKVRMPNSYFPSGTNGPSDPSGAGSSYGASGSYGAGNSYGSGGSSNGGSFSGDRGKENSHDEDRNSGGAAREKHQETGSVSSSSSKRPREAVPPSAEPSIDKWKTDYGKLIRQTISNAKSSPFAVLGLAPGCSLGQVKKRWTQLLLVLHPDKAPDSWKEAPEVSQALEAVNGAKREIERMHQATVLAKPLRPGIYGKSIIDRNPGTGKRRVEIHWRASHSATTGSQDSSGSKHVVDKYVVLLIGSGAGGPRGHQSVGTIPESSDPFVAIVEDDPRFAAYFSSDKLTVSIVASNAAGLSDPLVVFVPLA